MAVKDQYINIHGLDGYSIGAIELEEEAECSQSDSSDSEPEAPGLPSHIQLGEEII